MPALEYRLSVPRYLLLRSIARWWPGAASGPLGMLRLVDRPAPELTRPDWVRVRTRMAGICGSDLSLITAGEDPSLEPTCSPPFVVGHELVGEVAAVGGPACRFPPGTRVVMDAVLHCAIRGIVPNCAQCRAGRRSLCENFVDGCVAPGLFAGYNRELGGSWADQVRVHDGQLHAVPDRLTDEECVLLEPLCSVLHPLLSHPPPAGARVVVIGGGTLGQMAIATLRALGFAGTLIAVAKHPAQTDAARTSGADRVLPPGRTLLEDMAAATGARRLKGSLGPAMLLAGPEIVYDTVGRSDTVQAALQMVRGGGKVVLVGIAPRLDVVSSALWFKEVTLVGSCGSGGDCPDSPEPMMTRAIRLAESGELPLGRLVTHRHVLTDWKVALRAALGKARSGALKVSFDFRGS